MKQLLTAALISCVFTSSFAQVGIGTTTPNPSSVLELNSTNKAFIPPRMTSVQRDQIPNPVQGMMIYNTNSTCVEVYRGGGWFNLCTSSFSEGAVNGFYSSSEVEATSLIGYWPFDGNTTESIHTLAPVRSGGTSSFITGRIGQAIHFNNGWLTYPSAASDAGSNNTGFNSNDTLQHGFTLSLWAQVPDTSLLTNFFQLSTPNIPNWPILGLAYRRQNSGNRFDFNGGLGNVDGTGPHLTYAGAYRDNVFNDSLSWAFLAMTYDPADRSLKYYANGTLKTTIILTTLVDNPFPNSMAALLMIAPNYPTIGTFESSVSTPGSSSSLPGFMSAGITGNIDDIRLFKKTLSSQRINDLFVLGSQSR